MMEPNKHREPPLWPLRVLSCFYDDSALEGITGDLLETYDYRIKKLSSNKALWYFYRDALSALKPGAIRRTKRNATPNAITMFRNYFKLTLRNVKVNPTISIISILGLAISISCCITLFIFGQKIVTANDFIQDGENIHLIYSKNLNTNNDPFDWGKTPELLGKAIVDADVTGLLMTRYTRSTAVMRYNDVVIEEAIQYVDEDFMDIFSFELESGSREALKKGEVILTYDAAIRFFGDQSPIGKEVTYIIGNERISLTVGALAREFPSNTYFDFNILLPYPIVPRDNDWQVMTNATFVKTSNASLVNTLKASLSQYVPMYNASDPKYKMTAMSTIPFALLSTHEHNIVGSVVGRENESTLTVTIFFGSLLLFISCFNYINIALVAASKKLKEIGLRKSVGASRKELIIQFLSQNIIMSSFAVLVGLILAYFVLVPLFDTFFQIDFVLDLTDPSLWFFLIIIGFFTGLISGGYPAFYISSFSAVKIFSGKEKFGSNKSLFFKVFLGLQFGITFLIIFSGIAFYQNINHQEGLSWGYDQAGLITVPVSSYDQYLALRDKLQQRSDISAITSAERHIGKAYASLTFEIEQEKSSAVNYPVGNEYFVTMGVEVLLGRDFDPLRNESNTIIVNETFAKKYFINELPASLSTANGDLYEVIGIVKDFHYRDFYAPIEPVAFTRSVEANNRYIIVKTAETNIGSLDADIRRTWHQLFPDYAYNGYLQADIFDRFFREMSIPTNILITFAVISIFLSSIGLFGLVSLMISKRIKEIGVRKVLGAKMRDLTLLTNKPYLSILSISLIIAAPVSQNFVEGYLKQVNAYPVAIDHKILIPAVVLLLLVIVLTIGANLYKVANTNPAETLREE